MLFSLKVQTLDCNSEYGMHSRQVLDLLVDRGGERELETLRCESHSTRDKAIRRLPRQCRNLSFGTVMITLNRYCRVPESWGRVKRGGRCR